MARPETGMPNLTEDVAEGTVTVLFTDVQDSTELRVKRELISGIRCGAAGLASCSAMLSSKTSRT